MNFMEFVKEGYAILIVVIYIIGIFIKNTEYIKDKFIPIILMILGILAALAIGGINVDSVFQGIICTGIAVLGNQSIKQLQRKE